MKTILLACCLCVIGSLPARADDKLRDEPSNAESIGKLCNVDPDTGRSLTTTKDQNLPCSDDACKSAVAALCARWQGTLIPSPAPAPGVSVAMGGWQTSFVTGLGNTIADRAKAEVEAWFEDLMRDRLCALKSGGVRWFPETCKLLDDKLGVGQLATSMLAETMKRDFQSLLPIIGTYLESKLANRPLALGVLATIPAIAVVMPQPVTGRSPLVMVRDAARREPMRRR
jgi:hypothetical protein